MHKIVVDIFRDSPSVAEQTCSAEPEQIQIWICPDLNKFAVSRSLLITKIRISINTTDPDQNINLDPHPTSGVHRKLSSKSKKKFINICAWKLAFF